MKRLVLAFLVFSCLNVQNIVGQAQTLTYGFKAGLSLSKLDGPSEMNNGNELETNDNANGFFVIRVYISVSHRFRMLGQ